MDDSGLQVHLFDNEKAAKEESERRVQPLVESKDIS